MKHSLLIILAFILSACGSLQSIDEATIKSELTALMSEQDRMWSDGDIDGFMTHYWKSDQLRFASGGEVHRGWQTTIDRYKTRYPDRATMGRLTTTDLEIDVLSPQDALVLGRWTLTRDADPVGGLFTLHMKKINGEWLIISDHTSSGE